MSAWGASWGVAWGDSWGGTVVVVPIEPVVTVSRGPNGGGGGADTVRRFRPSVPAGVMSWHRKRERIKAQNAMIIQIVRDAITRGMIK